MGVIGLLSTTVIKDLSPAIQRLIMLHKEMRVSLSIFPGMIIINNNASSNDTNFVLHPFFPGRCRSIIFDFGNSAFEIIRITLADPALLFPANT